MALPTFNPSIRPSPGASHQRQVNILEAEFGDGYSQPTPNGLNHIRKGVTLRWKGLTLAQMQELDNFFTERGGTKAFHYKPHGMAVSSKWTCKEWAPSDRGGVFEFTATLKQSFTAEN